MDAPGWQPVIAVGVSGSQASFTALAWAAAEARRRGARLRLVQAWTAHPPRAFYAVTAPPARRLTPANAAAARLSGLADRALGHPAGEGAEIELIEGPAERVLVDASAQADLLVLGAGRQPQVGPVIRACLRHSRCAVVVVGPDLAGSARPGTSAPGSAIPLAGASTAS